MNPKELRSTMLANALRILFFFFHFGMKIPYKLYIYTIIIILTVQVVYLPQCIPSLPDHSLFTVLAHELLHKTVPWSLRCISLLQCFCRVCLHTMNVWSIFSLDFLASSNSDYARDSYSDF